MTGSKVQTQNLPDIPSPQDIVGQDGKKVSQAWREWFYVLRLKVNSITGNVINLLGLTGTGLLVQTGTSTYANRQLVAGTNIAITNPDGVAGNITIAASGGGGNAIAVNNQSGPYTLTLTDIPAASSYKGLVAITNATPNQLTIPLNSSVNFPIGSEISLIQNGVGATSFTTVSGVSLLGPPISAIGQYGQGNAKQILLDTWIISGNLGYFPAAISAYWNPSDTNVNITLSNGNKTATAASSNFWISVRANTSKSSGKYYFEGIINLVTSSNALLGIGTSSASLSSFVGSDGYGYGYYGSNGDKMSSGGGTAYGNTFTTGDIIGVALDLTGGNLWWSKNGVWQAGGNPSTGVSPAFTGISGTFFPMLSLFTTGDNVTGAWLAGALTYPLPTGFSSWS